MQDLNSTDPAQVSCPRACRSYVIRLLPGSMSYRCYRSGLLSVLKLHVGHQLEIDHVTDVRIERVLPSVAQHSPTSHVRKIPRTLVSFTLIPNEIIQRIQTKIWNIEIVSYVLL